MNEYTVIAANVSGKGNIIYKSGDVVLEKNFQPGRAEKLVTLGFLKRRTKKINEKKGPLKICVMITTFNRPIGILKLTKELKRLNPDVKIVVVDDCSDYSFSQENIDLFYSFPENNGKKFFYKTLNKLWEMSLTTGSDMYINMVDDVLPNENFFTDALRIWDSINDRNKIALDLANYDRVRNWTNFDRVHYNEDLYHTQTTEFSFLCLPEFIKYIIPPVNPNRWDNNPLLGSGCGDLLNRHWVRKKRTIYGVKRSLMYKNKHVSESLMNPEARKQHGWKLI